MTSSRRLWELMDLGRDLLEFTELGLLVGGGLLVETAQRTPELNRILQLQPNDTIRQLPERLAAHSNYEVLASHLATALRKPGMEKFLDQIRYIVPQILSGVPQEELWSKAGQEFSQLLSRLDTMRAGFLTTSDPITDLVAAPLHLTSGMQVLDPAAHAGQLLVAVGRKLIQQGVEPGSVVLHGYEPSQTAVALGQLNLLLNKIPHAVLLASEFLNSDSYPLGEYDAVLSIPPFNGDRVLDLERDPRFYRNRKGGRIKSESAYLQAGLAALKPGGQASFLMPTGVLFTGFYAYLRQAFASEGIVTAAVNLAPGLLNGTAIATALLVFDLPESGEAKSPSLRLVEAENIGEKSRAQRLLNAASIAAVVDGIRGRESESIKVCEVTSAQQADKDYIWLVASYEQQELHIESLPETQKLIPAAIQRAQETEQAVAAAMANLQKALETTEVAK